jgi:hypothetical protein
VPHGADHSLIVGMILRGEREQVAPFERRERGLAFEKADRLVDRRHAFACIGAFLARQEQHVAVEIAAIFAQLVGKGAGILANIVDPLEHLRLDRTAARSAIGGGNQKG